MNLIEKIIFFPIPIIFISLGLLSIFKTDWAYRYNLRQIENFANSVRNVPLLGFLANRRLKETRFLGKWFIRVWGVLALIIGIANLYAVLTQ